MIVTAILVWWDENAEDLEECIRGMATVADRVIAVDGAYRRYPGATVASPPEQTIRIMETAREVGLDCVIHTPNRLWAGQVEKRSYAFQQAAHGSDWIATFDSDWIAHGDRAAVRDELAAFSADQRVDVVTASLYTVPGNAYATNWHRQEEQKGRVSLPHFFRPLPGFRVEGSHWWYSAIKNGRRVWAWHGVTAEWPVLPQFPIRSAYEIEHKTLARDEKHILASRAFCNDRVRVLKWTGQEDDVPGLPQPIWDFETEPY
jgi:hypothetical protein